MLIVIAQNVTMDHHGEPVLVREDGTADYKVSVAINRNPPIWAGLVINHKRDEGAGQLLRLIAAKVDEEGGDKQQKRRISHVVERSR